jgi:uncharacterized repeat protein (TIGR03803 family)
MTYTVSGTVSGLNSGAQVTLENNASDPTMVKVNGSFSFATPIPYRGSYAVTVAVQPIAQNCTVTAGSGSGVSANVSGVRISCGRAAESVMHNFGVLGGALPSSLLQGSDGNFYGTTSDGGVTGNGTVFRVTPAGVESVFYSLAGGSNDGSGPTALIQGSDGNFYGTTAGGGTGNGTIFKITPGGVENVLYSFEGGTNDGAGPNVLIQGSDGNLYGTTSGGGTSGKGTAFKITPAGVESVFYAFASSPNNLIQGNDGNFYGTTLYGGTNGCGTVIKITPAGVDTVLHTFPCQPEGFPDGSYPSSLIQGSDGNFYGTTLEGGVLGQGEFLYNGFGILFKITPAGVETVLYAFGGGGAANSLIQGSDGNFYGTTLVGGFPNPYPPDYFHNLGCGSVYKITPAGVETALYSLRGPTAPNDGCLPNSLIQGSDGNFYGRTGQQVPDNTYGGQTGVPTVFKITPAGVETVLYSFLKNSDGTSPAALIQGSDGNFYGTTTSGGADFAGTVFKITPAGIETVLYSFVASFGPLGNPCYGPPITLIQASDGNFYGTTPFGGEDGSGTVFKITPAGVATPLYAFGNDGICPTAFIQGSDGNFYGTTSGGGTSSGTGFGSGTVFKITPAGVETMLYSFTGGADGKAPSTLIQGSDGNFYGTTSGGGATGYGTLFKITPAGVETVLYSFTNDGRGSITPSALVQGSDGNFYGTALDGGTHGTVFKITPAGVETVLYSFMGGSDGAAPNTLMTGSDGNFYGTTSGQDTTGNGTVFEITPAGVETVLHSFAGGATDGAGPNVLIRGGDGSFYGTTASGGTNDTGTVFKF